jgi:Glycosyltransferase family 87
MIARMASRRSMTRTVVVLSICGCVLVSLLQALALFDWQQGPVRFVLLVGIFVVAWWLARTSERDTTGAPPTSAGRGGIVGTLSLAAALALLAMHLLTGVRSAQRTHATGEILQDQGQINVRALALLEQGVNPYGVRTMLTPHQYVQAVGRPAVRACVQGVTPRELTAQVQRFWGSRRAEDMVRLYPPLSTDAHCAPVRERFDAFGYAYGPAMLQVYRPLWSVLGDAGVYATHVVFLLGIAAVLFTAAHRFGQGHRGVLALPLLIMLVPSHVATTTLVQSCADLPAVLFALLGWWALERGRARVAGVLVGASVACKLLPGALYLPLLLGSGVMPLALAGGTLLLLAAPYLLWDARGFWLDFVLHGFTRQPDSTSLAFYLPPTAATGMVVAGAAVLLAVLVRELRPGLHTEGRLRWLLAAHVVALATAGNFHNNYLTWLLPVLGLVVAHAAARLVQSARGGT